jgi:hypothetical protein
MGGEITTVWNRSVSNFFTKTSKKLLLNSKFYETV